MAIAALEPTVASGQVADSVPARDQLGRSDFLKMFVVQMQQQDPLHPLQGTEFTEQLAQFSSLEQLFNLEENSERLLEAQEAFGRLQALELIGKEVLSQGNALRLAEEATVQGSFVLSEAAARCTLCLYDAGGNPVRTMELGAMDAGEQVFRWDGLDDTGESLPPGTYTYEVWAENLEGEHVEALTRTSGTVTGVKLGGLAPVLYLGDIEIPLTGVLEVRTKGAASPAEAAAA
jgi:flagellar basal-body rod modification protein FlgD